MPPNPLDYTITDADAMRYALMQDSSYRGGGRVQRFEDGGQATGYGSAVPQVDAQGNVIRAQPTAEQQMLDRGIAPEGMPDWQYAQAQIDRGNANPGHFMNALSNILSIPEHLTGSSMGLDPMTGIIGKTGELHSIPKAGQYAASRVAPFATKIDDMVRELHASGAMPQPGLSIKDVTPYAVTDIVDPNGIEPPHGVRDIAKKEKLTENMEKNGWVGRPILVFDAGRGNEALTGSHRIAAAKQAGIEIPIYKIDESIGDYADKNGNTIFDAAYFEQEDIVKFLKKFGDKDAAKLMEQEIKANNKDNQQPKATPPKALAPAPNTNIAEPTKVNLKALSQAEREAKLFDTSHFDPAIVQRAKKDFGDTGKLSDAEYQEALAERANQYRIESILGRLGFNTSGYSNLSGSSYHNKKIGTEYDPKYGWLEHDTHQVRLANHPDYHPPMDDEVKQRFNINHAIKPSTWEDYHISPNMTDEQVHKILSGLDIPSEPDITKAHGGVVREAFKTGIHMKKGGKVSFANSLDAMRHELTRSK